MPVTATEPDQAEQSVTLDTSGSSVTTNIFRTYPKPSQQFAKHKITVSSSELRTKELQRDWIGRSRDY